MRQTAIVDSGGANHASIQNALQRLGENSFVTLDRMAIESSDRVILPGVGNAGFAMQRLREADLVGALQRLKQPVIGICLGMQLLFEECEEGDTTGLGVLPGRVRRLSAALGQRVPHMGWSQLESCLNSSSQDDAGRITKDIYSEEHFYFVHSFAAPAGAFTFATARGRPDIPAIVGRENFIGVQFHPEKSGVPGATLLKNFMEWST